MLAKFLKKEKQRIIEVDENDNTPSPSNFMAQFMHAINPEDEQKRLKEEEEEEKRREEEEKQKILKLKKFQKQFKKDSHKADTLNSMTDINEEESDILETAQDDDKPQYGGMLARQDKAIRDQIYRRSSKLMSISPLKRPSELPGITNMESSSYKSYNDILNSKPEEISPLKKNKFRIIKKSYESPSKLSPEKKQHIHSLIYKSNEDNNNNSKLKNVNEEYQFQSANQQYNKGNIKLIQNIQKRDTPGQQQRSKKLLARMQNENKSERQSKSMNNFDKNFINEAARFINQSPARHSSVKRSEGTPNKSLNQVYSTNTLATFNKSMLTSSMSPVKQHRSANGTSNNFYSNSNNNLIQNQTIGYNNRSSLNLLNSKNNLIKHKQAVFNKNFPSFFNQTTFQLNKQNNSLNNNDINSQQKLFNNTNNLGFYYKNKASKKKGLYSRISFTEFKEQVKKTKLLAEKQKNEYFYQNDNQPQLNEL